MQMIRTTINFPSELHRELRMEAIKTKRSLTKVVVDKLQKSKPRKPASDVQKRIKQAMKIFDEVARSGRQDIDLVKALREERDRDNA